MLYEIWSRSTAIELNPMMPKHFVRERNETDWIILVKAKIADVLGNVGGNGSLGSESDSGRSDTRISVMERLVGPAMSGCRNASSGANVDNAILETITPTDRAIIPSRPVGCW